jgi:bifunctional non-homologous end joining protein LigD
MIYMGLVEYKKKRSFTKTPEPTGGKGTGKKLQFVIQKHAASRLHYDFRLEMEGVLKSWAVPKGPSLNPADKRLAMLVEDHPFDYKDFEGNIPEGNYGAGTVIVWDQGTYEPLEEVKTKSAQEKILLKGFHAGSLKFRLHGAKLRGEFVLVKTAKRAENAWLLIKHRDEFATQEDVTEEDQSVVSGKTLDEVAADMEAEEWKSNRSSNGKSKRAADKKATTAKKKVAKTLAPKSDDGQKRAPSDVLASVKSKTPSPMPKDVDPMLATLADKPVDNPEWLYEIKWDGFRSISYLRNDQVDIRSRNNKKFNEKFYPIRKALEDWNVKAVVDGEIIVMNEKGYPDFNALQTWRSEADGELVYFLFDILWYEGTDLTGVPLVERRNILQRIVPPAGAIRLSESFDITGSELIALAGNMGLEGILAKKKNSVYLPGQRTKDWLKIKTIKQQEVVIGGYTKNENSSKLFSALLLGLYRDGTFEFIGPVGTGFTAEMQRQILKRLKPLETRKCPFAEVPDYNKPSRFRPKPPKAEVTWVRPELVAEVNYRTLASDGTFRHPSFKGLRDDKKAKEVVWEEPVHIKEMTPDKEKKNKSLLAVPSKAPERKSLLNPGDETQVRKIDGHELKFTNLSKVFWPEMNVTKRDMLNYYYQVVPYMLPYVKGRPQTLNRFPNGIHGKSFYQKDVTGKVPSWIKTHLYYSDADEREKHFLVCTNEASLLYIASLGCIEINPWSSRSEKPDHPDWCIIDLDPDKNTFDQVIEAARVTREVLDGMGVPSYCKTSGSTGLHIYIPLGGKYTYEESKEFGRAIAKAVHERLPAFTSIERLTSNRNGKMYIDFLQNRPQATVAGVYSLRPKPGAPVSMPLHWDEVKKGLKITDFNIRNAIARLRETGDLFEGVLGKGIDIRKALAKSPLKGD